MPYDEYLQGRFYREWAKPQGWLDSANAIIERAGTSSRLLRIVTSKKAGLVNDNMRGRLAQVVPHVRRATLVGKSIDLKHAEAAMLAETLDGLSAGIFLVDAKGRVVHMNNAAREIIDADDFLRSIGGRLVARDAEINQTLRDVFAVAGAGNAALGVKGIALTLTGRDGERYAAHVLTLRSGERRRVGITYAAVAAMFVRKTSLQAPSAAEAIGRAYRLTRAELRVLLAVVEVENLSEAADVLGIADTTVKFHLGNIYAKTGANRVAGLIKLMAGLSNPLLD
jgi:DNA-binding CsgD family transcriptional regulator